MVHYLGTQKSRFVAPIPERIGTLTMHFFKVSWGSSLDSMSQKSIVVFPICFGMGASNLIFKARTDLRWLSMNDNLFQLKGQVARIIQIKITLNLSHSIKVSNSHCSFCKKNNWQKSIRLQSIHVCYDQTMSKSFSIQTLLFQQRMKYWTIVAV